MNQYKIIALHGFLGQSTDWKFLTSYPLEAVDYFHTVNWQSMWDWAKQFNQTMIQQKDKPVLMGYSLGGRLALHCLIQNPSQWKAAIIISSHPGLVDKIEKQKRLNQDLAWSQRFKKEKWSDVIYDWNNQAVFKNDSVAFDRQEKDFDRKQLCLFLEQASLGKQDNLYDSIQSLSLPILWLTGEFDTKYTRLAQSLSFTHPDSYHSIVPQAGHRLIWQKPLLFKQIINDFLKKT